MTVIPFRRLPTLADGPEALELHARRMRLERDDLFNRLHAEVVKGGVLAQRDAAYRLARHLDAIIHQQLLDLANKSAGGEWDRPGA